MNDNHRLRQEIVEISKNLYRRRLVAGRGGNVSARLDSKSILITPHGVSLGYLREEELLEVDLGGKVISGEGKPSVEILMHLAIYRELPVNTVIHAHPTYATAFFTCGEKLKPLTYELTFALGEVPVIPQETPTVTDTASIIKHLRMNNIIVLKNHGVVAVGESLQDALFLIEDLEEAVKMTTITRLFGPVSTIKREEEVPKRGEKKYILFSEEHMKTLVRLINEDEEVKRRGRAAALTMRLAIKLDETGQAYNFHFQEGKIAKLTRDEEAEFIISGSREYWRAIFNRELEPFAATMQKKLRLKGDLGKLSRWYSPFTRIFELWRLAPVE